MLINCSKQKSLLCLCSCFLYPVVFLAYQRCYLLTLILWPHTFLCLLSTAIPSAVLTPTHLPIPDLCSGLAMKSRFSDTCLHMPFSLNIKLTHHLPFKTHLQLNLEDSTNNNLLYLLIAYHFIKHNTPYL